VPLDSTGSLGGGENKNSGWWSRKFGKFFGLTSKLKQAFYQFASLGDTHNATLVTKLTALSGVLALGVGTIVVGSALTGFAGTAIVLCGIGVAVVSAGVMVKVLLDLGNSPSVPPRKENDGPDTMHTEGSVTDGEGVQVATRRTWSTQTADGTSSAAP
jgi:hypothetical protein